MAKPRGADDLVDQMPHALNRARERLSSSLLPLIRCVGGGEKGYQFGS
jgi:hypothetical protein